MARRLYATQEGAPLTLVIAGLLANDRDGDGDALSLDTIGAVVGGRVTQDGAGNLIFTPEADFHGAASFAYAVGDGTGLTGSGTATVQEASVNV